MDRRGFLGRTTAFLVMSLLGLPQRAISALRKPRRDTKLSIGGQIVGGIDTISPLAESSELAAKQELPDWVISVVARSFGAGSTLSIEGDYSKTDAIKKWDKNAITIIFPDDSRWESEGVVVAIDSKVAVIRITGKESYFIS